MRASDCPTVDTTEFLLAALEQASEAVVIIDSDLRVSHFNAAAETIWGVARDDILGLEASCLGLTDLRPNSEITIRRADGSRLRASVSVSRVEIGGRSQLHGLCSRHHRRGRTPRADRASEPGGRQDHPRRRRHRSQACSVVYTNAAFSGMFGYSAEEAQGRQANQLLAGPLTDRKTLLRLRRRICAGCGDEEEVLAYDKNGDEIWVSATVKAFRNDRGRIKYIFALLSDISESKQLQVAAATDHGRVGRRTADHRDCRPALPAGRSHCARCRLFGAAHRFRWTGPPTGWAQPARRILPRTRRRRHRAGHRLVRIGGVLRRGRCWRRISTTTRAGSRSRRCRSRPA